MASSMTDREVPARKDRFVQIYYKDGISKVYHRHYIYPISVYNIGGLRCSVRDLSSSEITSYGMNMNVHSINVRLCHNLNISSACKVVFDGKVYNVQGVPDNYGFNLKDDTVLKCTEAPDMTLYGDNIYNE